MPYRDDLDSFEYLTIEASRVVPGTFSVQGFKRVRSGVLRGQTVAHYIDSFDTLEEAREAYPQAAPSHYLLRPVVSLDHLPDEGEEY